jgi:putative two-component system response regulator
LVYKIMVVDDEAANLRLLERLFRHQYQVITAQSGADALELLKQHDVALLITDQRMPNMTGIELLKRTTELRPHMVRIILTGYTDVGALVEAINCGQVYRYVTKPWNNDELRLTVERAIEHYESNKSRYELELANSRYAARLQHMSQSVVRVIADALEAKDEHVYGHARRVSGYAVTVGRRMRLDVNLLEQISLAALLHDVGKIATPDSILLKPDALTAEERAVMQLHSERGARILAGIPEMREIEDAIRYHHENFDGTGYPEGLSGEQIPLSARIIRVADAYDAMTSPRRFRKALGHETAIERLKTDAGSAFDPQVVATFCELEALAAVRRSIARGAWGGRLIPATLLRNAHELSSEELINQIEMEPVLAAHAMREANTDEPNTVSLKDACVRLGDERLRAIINQNSRRDRCPHNSEALWEHSLLTAHAAQVLAEHTSIINPEEAYTLGLLHDIGEVCFRSLFPEEMENILWFTDDVRIEQEIAAFGVDHTQVGHWILEACGLPVSLAAAVQVHHDALRINAPVALLLHVADVVAKAEDPSRIAALDALGSDRLALLRLSRGELVRIHEATTKAFEMKLALSC